MAIVKDLTVNKSIDIKAETYKVWEALTDPEKIREYFFNTNVESNWEVGSPIVFSGEFDGQSFKDKGTILDINENALLKYDYWSGFSGLEDVPENYSIVTYKLDDLDGITHLTLSQEGFASEEARDHSETAWDMVLEGLKKLVEEK